ncbi:MAG: PIG-L deacetylase family protein [Bryobacteraceae bacterium]
MIRDYLRRLYRILFPLIYSRAQYRLFINAALGSMDLRMLELASLTDYFASFVRSIPIRAPFGKSMLVLAPHQDDEAIGCGGTLALQAASKHPAAIVILQDGAGGYEQIGLTREQMTQVRNDESQRAAAVIDLGPPIFLNYGDLTASIPEATERIRRIIIERKVDAVFVPFVLDGQADHRAANYILAGALAGISWDVRVFGYEVWGLSIPNVMVIIDDVIEKKLEMLACFRLANSAVDYVNTTKGLNMYHARMLGAGQCKYAERFFEAPRAEYIELVERVRAADSGRARNSLA